MEIVITDLLGANRTYHFTMDIKGPSDQLYFTEPSIHLPTAYVGKDYSYKISIGGDLSDSAMFSSNSSFIEIDPNTGEITFEPDNDDKGEHWVKITVTNGNVTVSRSFIISIEEESEISNVVFYALGAGILLVIALIIGLYLWSGPAVEQYGLEE